MKRISPIGGLRRVLDAIGQVRPANLAGLNGAIMRVHGVQAWFLRNRGLPMTKRPCVACGTERLFSIWTDGRYHCLTCLYMQVHRRETGPIDLETDLAVAGDFVTTWRRYRARIEPREGVWVPDDADIRIAHLTRLRPPPICEADACIACDGIRPVMRQQDGGAGCVHCLMHGRIVELEIEIADLYATA